jgi:hydroxyethylthiazole kinase
MLQELTIAIVRGNAGEIGALSGAGGKVKGVESVEGIDDPATVARRFAQAHRTVVAITGKRDIISDGARVFAVNNGHPWLATLTGTGCMATTVCAAFAAVERNYALAAVGALATFGLAAELAATNVRGPASFKVAFFDQLYNLTPEQIVAGARIEALA